MKSINKLILHIVHNWGEGLNEAYAPSFVKKMMDQFQEEADDLNIEITDEQLKKYIERFDELRASQRIKEKDLAKYSLSQLIKLITSSKGVENQPEAADITPDIVYNQDGLIIYNGSNEGNCLNYGRGERWCITRGSFGNYRYDTNRKNPTFYLVKDNNIELRPNDTNSSDFRKSFFTVVVGSDNTYKVSDRTNNDVGGGGTEWDRWEPWSFVEQNFPSIRGLQRVFKYIPLSTNEKVNQQYSKNPISVREWSKLPYNVKEQYLVVRKGKVLFSDITNEAFIGKVLQKYPQISTFISTNAGILPSSELISNLDVFSNSDTRSIFANMRDKVSIDILKNESIPFEAKKLLVTLDKINLATNEHLYITKDGNVIVLLTVGDDISMNLYTEEDDYSNVKLNKRTSKYLMDYPKLNDIPLKTLLKLSTDGVISNDVINNVLSSADNSSIIVNDVEDGKLIIDVKALTAFKMVGDNIISIPFSSEEVQNAISGEEGNKALQKSIKNIFISNQNLPDTLDKNGVISVLNNMSDEDRKARVGEKQYVLLTTDDENPKIFWAPSSITEPNDLLNYLRGWGFEGTWRSSTSNPYMLRKPEVVKSYFSYLNSNNITTSWNTIKNAVQNLSGNIPLKKQILLDPNLPINPEDNMVPIEYQDTVYIINTRDSRNSIKLSPQSGKLIKANIPASAVRRLIGNRPGQEEQPNQQNNPNRVVDPIGGERRRGRPAGVANTPREPQQRQRGDVNIVQTLSGVGLGPGFQAMPRGDRSRLSVDDAVQVNPNGDRGATRRNNQLGNRGSVSRVYSIGQSKIYIIRVGNNLVASVNIQPGNRNYLITQTGSYYMNSPAELLNFLQARGLAEGLRTSLFKLHLQENPHMVDEIKKYKQNIIEGNYSSEESFKDYSNDALTDMIINLSRFEGNESVIKRVKDELERRKQNTIKNNNMKINEFKTVVREAVKKKLAENQPQRQPSQPDRETITKPDTEEEKDKKRRRIGNPNVDPKPKNLSENEQDIINKIVDRFKQIK